jgi:ABC-type lipoprotein export system ATPase subunit
MPLEDVLTVRGLDIFFNDAQGTRVDIASDLNLNVHDRSSLCLVGRSGSGKTSILRVIAGLAEPLAGTITWWGQDISTMSERERRSLRRNRIGYVDQAATLVSDLSALENVLLPVVPDGPKVVKRHEERARDLLRAFGLEARGGNRPPTLSGGERQRVAIARALLNAPDLLIVDEPTASLDATWADEIIRSLIEYQHDGCALLLASHDEAVIAASDTIIRVEPDRGVAALRVGQHQL